MKPHAKASPPGLWLEREASMGESSSPPLRRLRVAGERGALGLPSPEGGTRVWEGLVGNSGGKCGFGGSASGEVLLRCERDKGANLFVWISVRVDLTRYSPFKYSEFKINFSSNLSSQI